MLSDAISDERFDFIDAEQKLKNFAYEFVVNEKQKKKKKHLKLFAAKNIIPKSSHRDKYAIGKKQFRRE